MTCVYRKNSVIGPADPEDICLFANTDAKILFYCKNLGGKKNLKVPLVSNHVVFGTRPHFHFPCSKCLRKTPLSGS